MFSLLASPSVLRYSLNQESRYENPHGDKMRSNMTLTNRTFFVLECNFLGDEYRIDIKNGECTFFLRSDPFIEIIHGKITKWISFFAFTRGLKMFFFIVFVLHCFYVVHGLSETDSYTYHSCIYFIFQSKIFQLPF